MVGALQEEPNFAVGATEATWVREEYTVYAPSLHTSEDSRWDYRIIIVRASADAPPGQSEGEIAKALFPDQAAYKREENRRWELTANHWDLPIHIVNLSAE